MFDLDSFNEIWIAITRNRVRSLLTGFGVFWGIFMLMVMMGAGTGLERGMRAGIEGFATNSCFMFANPTSLPYKGLQKGRQWNMHNHDLERIRQEVPSVDALSPILFGQSGQNNVVNADRAGTYGVRGVVAAFNSVEDQGVKRGRFINDLDVELRRKVCVIGKKVYEELFPSKADPIGQYIRVNGIYYQVVGIAEGNSNISLGARTSQAVSVPITTMQQVENTGDVIHMITATALPGHSAASIEQEIKRILKANNRIDPEDQQAIASFNIEEQFQMFNYLFIGIATLIWIVGSGTLIAGIIGVSNIMLVTVRERTREIGVRRALGAKPATIMGQIMSEGLVLTFISGMLGLSLGVLVLHLADVYWLQQAENMFLKDPVVSFGTAIVSSIILLLCGVLAGAIPTARALQIKAIDAIREE